MSQELTQTTLERYFPIHISRKKNSQCETDSFGLKKTQKSKTALKTRKSVSNLQLLLIGDLLFF